jgi:serine protease Do
MKRFLVFVVLVILAVFAISKWNQQRTVPEKFTPASQALVDIKDLPLLTAMDQEYTRIVEAVVPSVVSINTAKRVRVPQVVDPFDFFFGPRNRRSEPRSQVQTSLGSGVIVSSEGHILTNNHVVANVDEIKVQLNDGREFAAKLIGRSESPDIAVLKIQATGIRPLPLGDSDKVKVGQLVLAIGNPFGLQETVTHGMISATGRQVSDERDEFFQTDTAINPGNSGGPLINLRGEIIAINTAIGNYSGSGTWQGVGFAIPANVARRAMDSIIQTGRVSRGYLGVVIQDLTPELAEEFGIPSGTGGALVSNTTPGSPAEKAGIKGGDVIVEISGKPVNSIRDLLRVVGSIPVGTEVKVKVIRQKQPQTLTATILEQPDDFFSHGGSAPQPQPSPQDDLQKDHPLAGIVVGAIPDALRPSLPENIRGVMVLEIDPSAPAARVLRPRDVIEQVRQQPVETPADFQRLAREVQTGERVMLSISRGKSRSFLVLTPQ